MSSLARSRSVRTKPSAPPSRTSTRDSSSEPRTASPSRLPINPHARTVSAASSSSSSSTRTAAITTRRPVSTTTTTRKTPSSLKEQQSSSSLRRETKTSSRYPPSTTVTRPPVQSTRPRSSGATASSTSVATQPVRKTVAHTRSRSTVTSLDAATVLHPPSAAREQAARRSGTPTTSRAGTPTTTGRPLLRKTGSIQVEKAAVAAKPQQLPTQPARPASRAARAAAVTASATATAPAAAQPKLRPAFSTLQQHYSPAKSLAPKPLTSTYLAPPSPSKLPANVAASAEVSKLQAELLQLYLLHRDAGGVDAQWRASAKGKLGERFAKLCETNKEVSEQERRAVEKQNVLALRRWGSGGGLDEKIQSLEAIVTGVWSLSDPGGRYARIVRRFERWIDRVCEVEDARRKGTSLVLEGKDTLFIGELDTSWKDDREEIIRRLDGWKRQLREINQLPRDEYDSDNGGEKSSLEKMLEGSHSLIEDMLAELNLMGEIEEQALAREEEWIERMNRDEDSDEDTPRPGAIWRVM